MREPSHQVDDHRARQEGRSRQDDVEEIGDDGAVKATKELPFGFSMMLPGFRGIAPLARALRGSSIPRGFVIVDKHQHNPAYPNVFSVGVCVAIAPVGPTPVPCGVPKTGFMIE